MRVFGLTAIWLVAALVLMPSNEVSAKDGMHVEYVGGTVASIHDKTSGNINVGDQAFLEFQGRKTTLKVQYDKINLLEYGQKVDRRYAMALLVSPMFLLTKSRQHYLTIGYTDEENRQQALVFRVDKGDIRQALVSLEARTGLKVQYQDGEARKAGKG